MTAHTSNRMRARASVRSIALVAAGAATIAAALTACQPKVEKATVPGTPTGVSASVGDAQSDVSFVVPGNGGSNITKYRLTSNRGAVTSAGTVAGHRLVTGLTNGTSYTFQLQACNAVGCSPWSASSNAVIPFGPQGAPALKASAAGQQIEWTWTAPTPNGRPIDGYRIWLDGTVIDSDYSGTSLARTFGYAEEHTLMVAAINSEGAQGATASATARTIDADGAPSITISETGEVQPGLTPTPCVPTACYGIQIRGTRLGVGNHSVIYHAIQGGQDRVIYVGTLNTSAEIGVPPKTWQGSGGYHQLPAGTEIYAVLDGYLHSNHLIWTA
ncbi:MAG: fibronectin type III domain-containing protein [Acidimicrobiales bacterium]